MRYNVQDSWGRDINGGMLLFCCPAIGDFELCFMTDRVWGIYIEGGGGVFGFSSLPPPTITVMEVVGHTIDSCIMRTG